MAPWQGRAILERYRNPHRGDLVAERLRAALQNADGDPRADDGVERVLLSFEREGGGVSVECGEARVDALDVSLQRGAIFAQTANSSSLRSGGARVGQYRLILPIL
jgi:hypothetical protein